MPAKLTQEKFIEKAKLIHGTKYDYSLVDYKNNYTKIKIICPICGAFEQTPNSHLRGYGCNICFNKIQNINTEQWIEKAKQIHGNKYNYELSNYINNSTKIKIICRIHGEFEQIPDNHCRGKNGCPKCAVGYSKGEKQIEKWLIDHNIKYNTQHRFINCKNVYKLSFDFYLFDYNICIEFDGLHHYEPVKYTGGLKNFIQANKRDNIKTQYCIDNNIKLIRIPYWNQSKIDEILSDIILLS